MSRRVAWVGSTVVVVTIAVIAVVLVWLALDESAPRISGELAVQYASLHARGWGLAEGEELIGLVRMTYAEAKTAVGSNPVARTGECGSSYCDNDVWVVTFGGTVTTYSPPMPDGTVHEFTEDNMFVLVDSNSGSIYSWGGLRQDSSDWAALGIQR
jgi:hypothetical protein